MVAGRLANIWKQTGIPPEQVVADAKTDPSIKEDLMKPVQSFEQGTPARAAMDKGSEEYAGRMATERYAKSMQAKRAAAGLPEPSVEFSNPVEDVPKAYQKDATAAKVQE